MFLPGSAPLYRQRRAPKVSTADERELVDKRAMRAPRRRRVLSPISWPPTADGRGRSTRASRRPEDSGLRRFRGGDLQHLLDLGELDARAPALLAERALVA